MQSAESKNMNGQIVLAVAVASVFGAAVSWMVQWVIQPGTSKLERRIEELAQQITEHEARTAGKFDVIKQATDGAVEVAMEAAEVAECVTLTEAGYVLTVDRIVVPGKPGLAEITLADGMLQMKSQANGVTLASNQLHAGLLVFDREGTTRIEATHSNEQTRISLADQTTAPRIVLVHKPKDRVLGIAVNDEERQPRWMVAGADESDTYTVVDP